MIDDQTFFGILVGIVGALVSLLALNMRSARIASAEFQAQSEEFAEKEKERRESLVNSAENLINERADADISALSETLEADDPADAVAEAWKLEFRD